MSPGQPDGALAGERVLVTGAAGFVGVNLCARLAREGGAIHGTVRPEGNAWRQDALEAVATVHTADLADTETVRRLIHAIRPTVVVHAAGPAAYDHQTWSAGARDGILPIAHLFDALGELPAPRPPRIVLLGSSLVYGAAAEAHPESSPLAPRSMRGTLKAAESGLAHAAARASGLPLVELRLFSVYGPWEPLHRLVPMAIRAALTGEELPLTRPDLRRDFVFVEDVADACLRAIATECVEAGVINIGSGQEVANEELVETVGEVVGRPVRFLPGAYAPQATDTPHWRADIDRAATLLGWRPRHSLAEGLAATVPWVRSQLAAGVP